MTEKISWNNENYTLKKFESIADGCGGVEIYDESKPDDCLIRISFWDTDGQHFVDVFQENIPLLIVEWAIFTAKQQTPATYAAERVFNSEYPDVKILKI